MRLLLALLLLATAAAAESRVGPRGPILGFTLLASAAGPKRFPVARALSVWRRAEVAHVVVLWALFGNDKTFLRRFTKLRARHKIIQIDPTCGPCRRNPGYGLQPAPGEARLIRQITRFAERHTDSDTRFKLALELEDQFGAREALKVYRRVRTIWPFDIVRNAIPAALSRGPWDFVELHGKSARCPAGGRHVADLDGEELAWGSRELANWLGRNSRCALLRVWREDWQGIQNGEAPPLRNRHFVITRRDLLEMKKLLEHFEKMRLPEPLNTENEHATESDWLAPRSSQGENDTQGDYLGWRVVPGLSGQP